MALRSPCARLKGLLRRFGRDRRGIVAVKFAFLLLPAIGFSGLAVDVGSFYYAKRRLQTAADLSAITAAGDLVRARPGAVASLAANGVPAGDLRAVETGLYRADPRLAPDARFVPGGAPANAVRVTLASRTPSFFGQVLTGRAETGIAATATAARTALASFAIGSRLASLEGGVLNALLGSLLGANVSLSVMDYRALATGRIDLFAFSRALASRLNLEAVSYDEVLTASARVGQVISAMADSTADPAARAALLRLPAVQASRLVSLRGLADLGPYGRLSVAATPGAQAEVAVMDLIATTLQISNGQNQIALGTNLGLPGIASASVKLAIGERPVGTSWITVGAEGARVHTAQTRLLVDLELIGTAPLLRLRVPLYVEIAAASAELRALSCGANGPAGNHVRIAATPAVVDAWIGQVGEAEFTNLTRPPNPPAATLATVLGLANVKARAHVTVTNLSPSLLDFGPSDIATMQKKTIGTQDFLTSLVVRLFQDTDITIQLLGLPIGLPAGLDTLAGSILRGAAPSVDRLLGSLLGGLGIGLGQADVWVTGLRCDRAVLVR